MKRYLNATLFVVMIDAATQTRVAGQSPGTVCKQGFVWREAFPRDFACVTPESRNQAARDNADPAQAEPCREGYVWREARPSDHVCVPVPRRSAVAEENRLAPLRVAGGTSVGAVCKQGFVWREAFPRDFACVTPESRNQAARDNADPARAEPCQAGYVWREARPSDHVCVPVPRRSAVAEENRLAPVRVAAAQAIDNQP